MDRIVPPRLKVDYTLEVRRILDGCLPVAGTSADVYLRGRGLSDRRCQTCSTPPT